MLCYTVACLTDKRALNLAATPSPPHWHSGELRGNRGHPFVCRDQKAGGGERGTIVQGIQMTGMFCLMVFRAVLTVSVKLSTWEGMLFFKAINHKFVISLI